MPETVDAEKEKARLVALAATEILDTAQESCFDSLTQLASKACGTSVSLVSLVDERRQWFKSRVGFGVVETPREFSFCSHAIKKPGETMIVEDATMDERFRDNPLVVGSPGIRFYAGVPLVTSDGHALGTLCVIDPTPRSLTQEQQQQLEALADHARAQLELRRAFHDMHELAAELEGTAIDLRATNEALEAFAASASHDLRAPLRRIGQLADAVSESASLDVEDSKSLRRIQNEASRLHSLVNGLLELGRATTGSIETAPVDVGQLAKDAFERLRSRDPDRAVSLTVEGDAKTRGDPTLLALALSNLVENAWKYTQDKDTAKISLRAQRASDGTLVVAIADNGVGFDPLEATNKLFLPFHRLHDSSKFPGTGVGLATVRRIVERHGGRIWAEGAPGVGATFYFTLSGKRQPVQADVGFPEPPMVLPLGGSRSPEDT